MERTILCWPQECWNSWMEMVSRISSDANALVTCEDNQKRVAASTVVSSHLLDLVEQPQLALAAGLSIVRRVSKWMTRVSTYAPRYGSLPTQCE